MRFQWMCRVQAESGAPPTATTVTQYVIKGALVFFAAVSVALVMLGMVISPAGARLVHLRTEAMLLVRGQLGPVNVRHYTYMAGGMSGCMADARHMWGISTGPACLDAAPCSFHLPAKTPVLGLTP